MRRFAKFLEVVFNRSDETQLHEIFFIRFEVPVGFQHQELLVFEKILILDCDVLNNIAGAVELLN